MLLQREDSRGRSRLFDVAGNMGGGVTAAVASVTARLNVEWID